MLVEGYNIPSDVNKGNSVDGVIDKWYGLSNYANFAVIIFTISNNGLCHTYIVCVFVVTCWLKDNILNNNVAVGDIFINVG